MKALSPDTPAMFFSCAEDKALCMAIVPKDVVTGKSFKASDWCKEVQGLINGKGGGKPENAQASGPRVEGVAEAMEKAVKFAMDKLGVAERPQVKLPESK